MKHQAQLVVQHIVSASPLAASHIESVIFGRYSEKKNIETLFSVQNQFVNNFMRVDKLWIVIPKYGRSLFMRLYEPNPVLISNPGPLNHLSPTIHTVKMKQIKFCISTRKQWYS